jgi:uncharacterized protein (TIGR03000 family)
VRWSPPLTPGKEFTYDLRAQWEENGGMVAQTQKVNVRAGANAEVSFPVASQAPRPMPGPSR